MYDFTLVIVCIMLVIAFKQICVKIVNVYVFCLLSKEPPELQLDLGMPREIKAMAGTHINIIAGIKGIPFPKVTWNKNEADVPTRAEIETSGTATKLEMRYCTRGDCGDYTLTIENPAGSKTATCTVLVLGIYISKTMLIKQIV